MQWQDFLYLGLLVVFTGVVAMFVVACDQIVGSDEAALAEEHPAAAAVRTRREEVQTA